MANCVRHLMGNNLWYLFTIVASDTWILIIKKIIMSIGFVVLNTEWPERVCDFSNNCKTFLILYSVDHFLNVCFSSYQVRNKAIWLLWWKGFNEPILNPNCSFYFKSKESFKRYKMLLSLQFSWIFVCTFVLPFTAAFYPQHLSQNTQRAATVCRWLPRLEGQNGLGLKCDGQKPN